MNIFDLILKKRPDRADAASPSSPMMVMGGSGIRIVEYSNILAGEMAMQHPVVFRCLNKIATSVATVSWKCVRDDSEVGSRERVTDTYLKSINDVLSSPNDILSQFHMRYWMALNYAIYGRVPFLVGTGLGKIPNAIYPLEARFVKLFTTEKGLTDYYEYGPLANGQQSKRYYTRRYSEKHNVSGPYIYEIFNPGIYSTKETSKATTTLASIGLPSSVTSLLLKRAVDTASGHPNSKYIITAEKTLTKEQKTSIEEYIASAQVGETNSGNVLFLYNTKIEVHELPSDLSDLHTKLPMDDMSRMIFGAFGIPIALMGLNAADGAKFAGNYSESRRAFWEDTMIPSYLTPISIGLTDALCLPGSKIVFDHDTIPAMQDARAAKSANLEGITFMTIDEKRELAGLPKLDEASRRKLEQENAAKTPNKDKVAK